MFLKYKTAVINMNNIIDFYLRKSEAEIHFYTANANDMGPYSNIKISFCEKNLSSLSEEEKKKEEEIASNAFDLIVRELENQPHTATALFNLDKAMEEYGK
jgi:hypothetical protein